MVNIHQKKSTNKNLQDAIGERAEQDRRELEGEVRDAVQPEGGVGGRSGTGQEMPHHGYDDAARKAKGTPEDPELERTEPRTGPGYQSGGRGLDLARQIEERKQRESGVGRSKPHGPGMGPPPGAPVDPHR